jgi:hypothetical protein
MPGFAGTDYRLGPVRRLQLVQDVEDVIAHRLRAEE